MRDRVRLDEFAPVLGGRAPSWTGLDEGAMARVNELHLGPLRPLSWEEAVRLLQATREQLVAALVSVPSHPAELWTEAHPFGAMLLALRTKGRFVTNPPVSSSFDVGDVLIVVGTEAQVDDLHRRAHP